MAEVLAHDVLPVADVSQVRMIWNSNVYGGPGPQSVLNATIRDAEPLRQQEILRNFDYLLWGDEPDEVRINRVLDQDDLGMTGLGESVIVKLLSVAHPERWIPIFPYAGENGKRRHLLLLDLDPPDPTLTRGKFRSLRTT